MRGARMSWTLVAMLVTACASEATTPQAVEPVPTASPVSSASSTTRAPEPIPTTTDMPPTVPTSAEPTTTTSPTSPPTTARPPLDGAVVLRGDGIGDARFGRPMDEVDQWLVGELGAPVWETVARAPLAASQWYEARGLFRSTTFEMGELSTETGRVTTVTVLFSDMSDARREGIAHLAGWETSLVGTEELAFPAGLRIGMPQSELEERFPDLVLTPAPGFEIITGDSGEAGIRGALSGGVVVELEAGLRLREHDEIPVAPPTPDGPVADDPVLRPDGLGSVDLRGRAHELVAALEARFGPPTEEINVRARPGDTLRGPLGYFPESELRHLRWFDPGLTVLIADGVNYGGTEPGDLRLVFWATSSTRLRLETGLGVGSTLAELTRGYPAITVGIAEECSGAHHPAAFTIETEVGRVRGALDWDWVSEVQQALNDRGATLAVDGEYGPRTRAAVEAFQTEAAIETTAPWDGDGWIGPLTLDALGVAAPPMAPVGGLRAGSAGSC